MLRQRELDHFYRRDFFKKKKKAKKKNKKYRWWIINSNYNDVYISYRKQWGTDGGIK